MDSRFRGNDRTGVIPAKAGIHCNSDVLPPRRTATSLSPTSVMAVTAKSVQAGKTHLSGEGLWKLVWEAKAAT